MEHEPYEREGYEALWGWFGIDRASFLVLPRILMHEMPDEWQGKMAALLAEYEEAFPGIYDLPNATVTAKKGKKFCRWPDWLLNYRRPDKEEVQALREAA